MQKKLILVFISLALIITSFIIYFNPTGGVNREVRQESEKISKEFIYKIYSWKENEFYSDKKKSVKNIITKKLSDKIFNEKNKNLYNANDEIKVTDLKVHVMKEYTRADFTRIIPQVGQKNIEEKMALKLIIVKDKGQYKIDDQIVIEK